MNKKREEWKKNELWGGEKTAVNGISRKGKND